jgi:hypothetical protein
MDYGRQVIIAHIHVLFPHCAILFLPLDRLRLDSVVLFMSASRRRFDENTPHAIVKTLTIRALSGTKARIPIRTLVRAVLFY